ncbi:epididymal protein 13 isoform X2 [Prionailurus iriomotensis]
MLKGYDEQVVNGRGEVKEILGLLSLQVLSEETNDCKEAGKISLATATSTKKPPTKRTRWNLLKCTYMMVTFLFVSYNKGDWCYCHSCSTEVDIRFIQEVAGVTCPFLRWPSSLGTPHRPAGPHFIIRPPEGHLRFLPGTHLAAGLLLLNLIEELSNLLLSNDSMVDP